MNVLDRKNVSGFSLVEVIVATLCLGLCLGPFLAYSSRLPEMQKALAAQARDDAWRSFQDQAVLTGVDAGRSSGLGSSENRNVPVLAAREVERLPLSSSAGLPSLRLLQVQADAWNAKGWVRAAGYELSSGPAVPAVLVPESPLPPLTLGAPVLSPDPGLPVSALALASPEPGASGKLRVEARSSDGGTVILVYGPSSNEVRRTGEASFEAGAETFAEPLSGRAWAEYAGDVASGDSSVLLPDGRKRWIVREGSRSRVYNPSAFVPYRYLLDLGAPVLVYGESEYAPGGGLTLTYSSVLGVRSGAVSFRVGLSSEVRKRLGSAAASLCQSFDSSFGGWSAPSTGDLSLFCREEQQDRWSDSFAIQAAPHAASGCLATEGSWYVSRLQIEMGEPVLLSDASSSGGAFSTESIQFAAPVQADGIRRGRLSAREGTLLSASSELSLVLVP